MNLLYASDKGTGSRGWHRAYLPPALTSARWPTRRGFGRSVRRLDGGRLSRPGPVRPPAFDVTVRLTVALGRAGVLAGGPRDRSGMGGRFSCVSGVGL